MALTRARPLFSPRWVAGLAPVAEAGMAATISIFTPTTGSGEYNPDTDTWTYPTPTVHYAGIARVQPVRSARETDATTVQTVRFQIPLGAAVLRPDMQVEVTACELNPTLLTHQYVVVDTLDSSNPFETTFECTVNTETVV